MKQLSHSWKHFTAHAIHEALGRVGNGAHFWMGETYDHVVRSARQFEHYREYMRENPVRARLEVGEYALFLPEDCELGE